MVATFEQKKNFTVVGTRPIRHDGLEKVTGRAVSMARTSSCRD